MRITAALQHSVRCPQVPPARGVRCTLARIRALCVRQQSSRMRLQCWIGRRPGSSARRTASIRRCLNFRRHERHQACLAALPPNRSRQIPDWRGRIDRRSRTAARPLGGIGSTLSVPPLLQAPTRDLALVRSERQSHGRYSHEGAATHFHPRLTKALFSKQQCHGTM